MNKFTLFFCSSKKIHEVAKNIPNPKAGCSTVGEINGSMLTNEVVKYEFNSSDFKIDTVKIPNTKIPVMQGQEIIDKAMKVKAGYSNLIAFVLNDGLSGDEEKVQSLLENILPKGTVIVGGSSGDDFDFKDTYCCIDDEVFKGAVVILIGTNLKYYVHKENIYKPTDKYTIVTKADGRTISELDGVLASNKYSDMVDCSAYDIDSKFFEHPLGRYHNGTLLISSPKNTNPDKSIWFKDSCIKSLSLKLILFLIINANKTSGRRFLFTVCQC